VRVFGSARVEEVSVELDDARGIGGSFQCCVALPGWPVTPAAPAATATVQPAATARSAGVARRARRLQTGRPVMKKTAVTFVLAFLSLFLSLSLGASGVAGAAGRGQKPHQQGGFMQRFKTEQKTRASKQAAAGRSEKAAKQARVRADGKTKGGGAEHTKNKSGKNWDRHSKSHSSRDN
jgi:uncharacterized protein HemX